MIFTINTINAAKKVLIRLIRASFIFLTFFIMRTSNIIKDFHCLYSWFHMNEWRPFLGYHVEMSILWGEPITFSSFHI